jgi:hypothetical protein
VGRGSTAETEAEAETEAGPEAGADPEVTEDAGKGTAEAAATDVLAIGTAKVHARTADAAMAKRRDLFMPRTVGRETVT